MRVTDLKPNVYLMERKPGSDFRDIHYLIQTGMEVIAPPGTVAPVGNRARGVRVDQDDVGDIRMGFVIRHPQV